MAEVIVYVSPGCPDCAAVKAYLQRNKIEFEDRSIMEPGVADDVKHRYGVRIAPITVIKDNAVWGTFAEQKEKLDQLLGLSTV